MDFSRDHAFDTTEPLPNHVRVEKLKRCQRLILGRRRHSLLDRQGRQKHTHLRLGQLLRMPASVKPDIASNPVDVRLTRARTEPVLAEPPPNGVHESR
jgi:hypothetical protein